MKTVTKLWIGIAILISLSPLGLIVAERFKAGSAWGEWGAGELQKLVGYIPQGLGKLAPLWKAPMSDYNFKGWGEKGLLHLSLAYIISAVVGIGIIAALTFFVGKLLTKKDGDNGSKA